MRLIECYVESFGKIKDKRIDFSEGLNCILADNGAGKTTLATFIKVMLYGMSDTKKTSLEENDRRHYLPWDGSAARGTLTFRTGEREYRIERGFAAKPADDTFTLYDLSTGKVTKDFGENLGEELFGIDAEGFERTVFLSERALTPRSDNKSISAKLSDLVGCDGDIGVMDDAMKALEEGRKFYYKKGGSGELANIKSRVSEAKSRLERLEEIEELSNAAEEGLATQKAELDRLNEARSALTREREAVALASAKADLLRHNREIKAEITALSERRAACLAFLGESVPTHKEINEAALKLGEAARLESEAKGAENPEYRELFDFFVGKTDEDEVAQVKRAIYETKRKKSLAEGEEAKKLRARFSKRIPTHGELDELIMLASRGEGKSERKPKGALILAGTVLLIAGVCLGFFINFALFTLAAIGGILVALAFTGKGGKAVGRKEKFSEFYFSVSDSAPPADDVLLSDLIDIKSAIDRAAALQKECAACDEEGMISRFSQKFGLVGGEETEISERIIAKFERFTTLCAAESFRQSGEKQKRERGEKLRSEALAFIGKFPTVTDDPCSEIRERLSEYERLSADLTAKEREAENFARQYGNGADGECEPLRSAEEIGRNLAAVEAKIAEVSRECTLTEQMLRRYAEELDGGEELYIRLSELEEALALHTENYNVILKTKEFLEKAKDTMTAKYLGKTKSGFERYTEVISGIAGERFEMSTDFGVTKLEGASAKSSDAYSRGTKDLYNLAARLALVDSLYEGEEPFIILDDPFVSFDDKKCGAALNLLSKLGEGRQIIYFTCSKSRAI